MLKKFLYALSILWGIVTVIFLLFNVLPDDPSQLTLGQRSDAASIKNVKEQLNLDKPVVTRYLLYLNDLSPVSWHSNDQLNKYKCLEILAVNDGHIVLKYPYLGRSYHTKKLVTDTLFEALPGTFILAFAAMIIGTIMGILLGILSAIKKGTVWDTSAIMASVVGISTPSFFAGLLISYLFGFVLNDVTGLNMIGNWKVYNDDGSYTYSISNLILPAITLGIRPLAIIAQLTRSSMLDVLSQDYIRTAYAKGLSGRQVIFKHALPNSLNPIITAVSGWFAELLAGSFFVEFVFSWKGLGKVTVDALEKFDFPVVMGAILFTGSIFVVINTLTDIVYRYVDPRMR